MYSHLPVLEAISGGVTNRTFGESRPEYDNVWVNLVDIPRPEEAWAWCLKQVGKPYDYTSLLGLFLNRDWQEDDSWNCSEIWAAATDLTDQPLIRAKKYGRVTPRHLGMSVRLNDGQ